MDKTAQLVNRLKRHFPLKDQDIEIDRVNHTVTITLETTHPTEAKALYDLLRDLDGEFKDLGFETESADDPDFFAAKFFPEQKPEAGAVYADKIGSFVFRVLGPGTEKTLLGDVAANNYKVEVLFVQPRPDSGHVSGYARHRTRLDDPGHLRPFAPGEVVHIWMGDMDMWKMLSPASRPLPDDSDWKALARKPGVSSGGKAN